MIVDAVRNVFRRYLLTHAARVRPGFAIRGADGAAICAIDRIVRRQEMVEVAGWADAASVTLAGGAHRATARPSLPRDTDGGAGTAHDGFRLRIPDCGVAVHLDIATAAGPVRVALPGEDRWQAARVRTATAGRFAVAALACLPDAMRYRLRRDEAAKARVKARLGFDTTLVFRPLDAGLPVPAAPCPRDPGRLSIVMPIHDAFDVVPEAVSRVLDHTDGEHVLILVDDASTDPRMRPWLAEVAAGAPDRVRLIGCDSNLGFVGAVNRGLDAVADAPGHVVLLNSDAMVPPDWRRRLMAPIAADPAVASVTAMSNDAEIATAPVICVPAALPPGAGDRIDRTAARLDPARATAEAPTGVGFCIALNRRFLDRLPRFDTAFGRGYGEEVDWCRKAAALGGRHLLTGALFVEHRGGASFGSAEKRRRILDNNALIANRYPGYDASVQDFIRSDPLASPRMALALATLAASHDGPVPVYLAHSLGGGAEHALQAEIAAGPGAVVLRVGGNAAWQIDVRTPAGITSGTLDTRADLRAFLDLVPDRHVIYSCGVGAADPREVPALLLDLAGGAGPLTVLFHDFYPVSPSYCLLGGDGRYRGVPAPDTTDPAHRFRSGEIDIAPAAWRAMWAGVLDRAGAITVFSEASRRIVAEAFPTVATRIETRPHRLHAAVPACTSGATQGAAIGVLGNIGAQKGAAVVAGLAKGLGPRGGTAPSRIVVIGEFDLNYRIPRRLIVHGRYELSDLDRLVAHYGIACWLIPSVWPETFSYVTHEALATGLPVFCGDLGAQADAVRRAPNGTVLAADPHDAAAILAEIRAELGWTGKGSAQARPRRALRGGATS